MRTSTLLLIMLGVASLGAGQPAPGGEQAIKVGIFPFADATASGNRSVGADVGRTMASEVTHSTTRIPRMLAADGSARAEDLDGEKATTIGREQKVDFVFMGTVLEARDRGVEQEWMDSFNQGSVRQRERPPGQGDGDLAGRVVRRGNGPANLQRPCHG